MLGDDGPVSLPGCVEQSKGVTHWNHLVGKTFGQEKRESQQCGGAHGAPDQAMRGAPGLSESKVVARPKPTRGEGRTEKCGECNLTGGVEPLGWRFCGHHF